MDGQLLQFRVANHRSLRDEQELSFIADRALDDPRLLHPAGVDEAVLPVCTLYGANASGKSNVLDALGYMRHAVISSHRLWERTGIRRQPFALRSRPEVPSSYIVNMVIEGVRYEYGFSLDDQAIQEEWLYAWPSGRKQEWFSRELQAFDFGRHLPGENKAIAALTRANSLFLSAAAQNNHAALGPIFDWFRARLRTTVRRSSWNNMTLLWWKQFLGGESAMDDATKKVRQDVLSLLRTADLGIDDFRVTEEIVHWEGDDEEPPSVESVLRIGFSHAGSDAGHWLDVSAESTGTRSLVGLCPVLLPVLNSGGILVIDELNALHPMLALALVQLFQRNNPRGAQLLFNTHDSSLLGNLVSDPPPLRRDQIWFTEKDQEGATKLYPLTDFTPRKEENLQRGYLQGRYGAVPFIGSLGSALESGGEE